MSSVFSNVAGLKPGLTSFNLTNGLTCDVEFGKLYPVACFETLPGDVWNMDNLSVVARLTSALKSPILSDIDVMFEAFFVPNRLLMGDDANFDTPSSERRFDEMLTGGKKGNEIITVPHFDVTTVFGAGGVPHFGVSDYLGIQPSAKNVEVMELPYRAYRWIWNEYYRFEALEDEIKVVPDDKKDYDNLLYRGWKRDYFTSCLPYQQFGTAPALSLSGFAPLTSRSGSDPVYFGLTTPPSVPNSDLKIGLYVNGSIESKTLGNNGINVIAAGASGVEDAFNISMPKSYLTNVGVNMDSAGSFDVTELRTAFQIQKWLERNARAGVRYTEYLQSHFGVSPSDARLQRPEFIGSYRLPFLISEVLQTSQTSDSSVQGNQAGQGIAIGRGNIGKYKSYEFGWIMILASVAPKPQYQQGIPRQYTRINKLDWYSPEFAHLSEQAVLNREIYCSGDRDVDEGVFGFQGIWNELRYIPSRVAGHMRSNSPDYSFDYWHQARAFSSTPKLNSDFLSIGSTSTSLAELNRVFAVQDEYPFILDIGYNFRAMRPLPYVAEPGLVDHF